MFTLFFFFTLIRRRGLKVTLFVWNYLRAGLNLSVCKLRVTAKRAVRTHVIFAPNCIEKIISFLFLKKYSSWRRLIYIKKICAINKIEMFRWIIESVDPARLGCTVERETECTESHWCVTGLLISMHHARLFCAQCALSPVRERPQRADKVTWSQVNPPWHYHSLIVEEHRHEFVHWHSDWSVKLSKLNIDSCYLKVF